MLKFLHDCLSPHRHELSQQLLLRPFSVFGVFHPAFLHHLKRDIQAQGEKGERQTPEDNRERESRSRRISGNQPHACSPHTHRNEVVESRVSRLGFRSSSCNFCMVP
ncbi:hypothetical protein Hanom_Chr16g01429601 [Helianthus anomalus]